MNRSNSEQVKELINEYPALIKEHQKSVIYNLVQNRDKELHY